MLVCVSSFPIWINHCISFNHKISMGLIFKVFLLPSRAWPESWAGHGQLSNQVKLGKCRVETKFYSYASTCLALPTLNTIKSVGCFSNQRSFEACELFFCVPGQAYRGGSWGTLSATTAGKRWVNWNKTISKLWIRVWLMWKVETNQHLWIKSGLDIGIEFHQNLTLYQKLDWLVGLLVGSPTKLLAQLLISVTECIQAVYELRCLWGITHYTVQINHKCVKLDFFFFVRIPEVDLNSLGDKHAEVCDANELNGKPTPTLRSGESGFGFWRDCAGYSWSTRCCKEIFELWQSLISYMI